MFEEDDFELEANEDLKEEERDRIIYEGKQIESMLETDGWKLIEKEINSRIEVLKSMLVTEKDMREIVRWQEAIKWGMALKNFIFAKVSNAKVLLENKTREEELE